MTRADDKFLLVLWYVLRCAAYAVLGIAAAFVLAGAVWVVVKFTGV